MFLYVHHHIREDAQTLFGFTSRDERQTFQVLINTHGIGPALAMAILATHPPAALVDIVANNDLAALTLVPGVGKKTAERLLVELRDRLSVPMLDGAGTSAVRISGGRRPRSAGRSRLRHRGDPRRAARAAVRRPTRPRLLRDALKLLGARVRDEFLDPGIGDAADDDGGRDRLEAGLRPRRSTSSSASAS